MRVNATVAPNPGKSLMEPIERDVEQENRTPAGLWHTPTVGLGDIRASLNALSPHVRGAVPYDPKFDPRRSCPTDAF